MTAKENSSTTLVFSKTIVAALVLIIAILSSLLWLHRINRSCSSPQNQVVSSRLNVPATPTQTSPSHVTENQDARGLTVTEANTFLPLICLGVTQGAGSSVSGQSYQYHCDNTISYPNSDTPNSNLTMTSLIYGHLTDSHSDQAYVSYLADFEGHADNWGGGILFEKEATGWSLVRWYPGQSLDNCLMLTPSGKAKMLCLSNWRGQGEVDTYLTISTIPLDPDEDFDKYGTSVLKVVDDRIGDDPNDNCKVRARPDQSILLSLDNIARSDKPGVFAEVGIQYVKSSDVTLSCEKGDFAEAAEARDVLMLTWDGKAVAVQHGDDFASTGF